MTERLYPVFLRLQSRKVLIVGAGPVAVTKLSGLLEAKATVVVVAPEVHPDIEASGVEIRRRGFESADLEGMFFVVAAAPPEINRQVQLEAECRGLFVNAVDDVRSASAYLGGVVRRGGVTVAISTEGRAPAMAGLLRESLESLLPDELEEWMNIADRMRKQWKEQQLPMHERRPLLLRALVEKYEQVETK